MSNYDVTEFVSDEDRSKFTELLASKEPSSLHEALAAYILDVSGVEISEKQVQAVLSIHGTFQKSEANKNRAGYKARTIQSIRNGGETTARNMEKLLAGAEEAPAEVEAPKEEAVEEAPVEEAPKPAATKKAPTARRSRKAPAKKEPVSA